MVTLEILGMPNSSPGVPGGQPVLTCLGIWSLKGCHASTCLGIRQFRGPRRSTCLDLPRVWSSKFCHTCSGICQSRGPRMSTCLDLPGNSISRRLPCLSLPGDLHPDPGMPGSQVATVLGRISLKKDSPLRKSTHGSRRMPIRIFSFPPYHHCLSDRK